MTDTYVSRRRNLHTVPDLHTLSNLQGVHVRVLNPWDEQRRGMVTQPRPAEGFVDSTPAEEFLVRVERDAEALSSITAAGIDEQEALHLRLTIQQLLADIDERKRLRDKNVRELEETVRDLESQIALIRQAYFSTERNPEAAKQKSHIQRELASLQKALLFEPVAAWKDIAQLKSELMEHVGALLQLLGDRALASEVSQRAASD